MNQNVPNNDGRPAAGPDWAQMRPEDFDASVSPALFDVPAAPVTGGLFDLLDGGQADGEALADEVPAVPVGEPLYGATADRVGEMLAEARREYQQAETARQGQSRRDDANLAALAGPVDEGSPTDAVRELLAAVLDALDIPAPATVGDRKVHDRVLNNRAMHAKIALGDVLDGAPLGVEWVTEYLRERLAEHPPTGYVTTAQAHAARAAGKPWSEAVTPEGGA
ncbi:hypothetical protein NGM36_26275 [Streptomyces mutabilis]|uniref:hypothetical protein n=1 Tax=Streptomyces mutabilis TaxID=67332 RepID=UPI0022BA1A5D|nr:hypothetical protein [Streptomyces mutabilis]MCZ9353230.1 hypothetical protein [Streptomyces mutabilis]